MIENDSELLRLAFKAWVPNENYTSTVSDYWDPLVDDGDAFRLAVRLGIGYLIHAQWVRAITQGHEDAYELTSNDPYAATRRAIVRAAAEIGKSMENTK